ncbi:hypothetical protein DAPPUDRAFT_115793 [Daphnia pulex]|uniref:Integrase core domain-containing protein n=1 Tax=Daphnia pulex TaxID=6669 RepID=E9HMJ5_DAPPU|nr:hypothetical protein DAPPUDRAFT_115793 [Daphnia pulex]|eukprot:EFX67032.1 hypothetical protein DAPPUDRAFT_115793 [Daphnia pulex]
MRRVYYVRAPLSVIHLDGNHKLVRSRTVLNGFITVVRKYGLPSRLRLERRQLLDPDNEEDILCLHFIFLPVIQTFIDEFVGSWIRHGLRTVRGNLSPTRLLTTGLRRLQKRAQQNHLYFTELDQNIDYNGELTEVSEIEDDIEQLHVPAIEINLDRAIKRRLKRKYGAILCRLKIAKRSALSILNDLMTLTFGSQCFGWGHQAYAIAKRCVFSFSLNCCWSVSDLTERGSAFQTDGAAQSLDGYRTCRMMETGATILDGVGWRIKGICRNRRLGNDCGTVH